MTEAEKELTKDVVAWYAKTWNLGPPGLKRSDVQFLQPEIGDDYEYDTFRFSRARFYRVALYSALFGLLLACVVFAWAEWFSVVTITFFALTFGLVWFFPILAVVLRERAVIVYYGPGLERDLAHQMALWYLNANPVRECLHALVDAIIFPFALSYQEGLAAWLAAEYIRQRDADSTPSPSIRARNGRRLAWLVGKLAGRRALRFLLRWG